MTKEYASDGNSVLDHLVSHISGDAFTTSTLNSPNHPINKFLSVPVHINVDPEPEISYNIPSPPPLKSPECVFRASPMHIATPEQEIHNSITITEIPIQTSMPDQATLENPSEVPQENQNAETTPEQTHIPTSEKCDDIPSDNQEHHIPQSPVLIETIDIDTPPSSPLTFGPAYKPLTLDEIITPSDQMLPLMENIIMQSVDIDDSPESLSPYPKINISNIKIKPLKRKKP
jgi:hypothetical protein